MDIDIILECDVSPAEMTALAVEAERLGIRAIWSSNYHQNWDCFLALSPAAIATSRIKLGCLAVSPWELHPLKMANALLTLNEISAGRAMVAVSGGGGVLGALGWRIHKDAPVWPLQHEENGPRYPERRVRGVRECLEVLELARSGDLHYAYDGEIFQITRPFKMDWAKSSPPLIYGCCSGPMMIRMGAQFGDGIQISDATPEMIPDAQENVRVGMERRTRPPEEFRLGNFWAFHIKEDRDVSLYEARRELIWRAAIAARWEHDIRPYCHDDDEVQLVIDNWGNIFKAHWTRSGKIDGLPEDLVNRLIAGMTSAGTLDDVDREIARYKQFEKHGLTELSLRLFDNPMDGLRIIGERVLPAFH